MLCRTKWSLSQGRWSSFAPWSSCESGGRRGNDVRPSTPSPAWGNFAQHPGACYFIHIFTPMKNTTCEELALYLSVICQVWGWVCSGQGRELYSGCKASTIWRREPASEGGGVGSTSGCPDWERTEGRGGEGVQPASCRVLPPADTGAGR